MPGIPSVPRTGLPTMTPEGTLQRRGQLYYSSPFAAGAYIIRGGTIKNTTGATQASGLPEGLLLSYDPTNDIYLPWTSGDDLSGETYAAAGVLRDGYGESLVANATFLSSVIIAAHGGLRCSALYYNNSGTIAVITGTQRDAFIADYIAGTNTAAIGAASYSAGLDPDITGAGALTDVLFYG